MIKLQSNQKIIDCLKNNYAIEIVKLTLLPLGADRNASVYKAETQNQSLYFIKLKRGQYPDINTAVLKLLQNAGIQQIIYPVEMPDGQLTLQTKDFTLIVYPFIAGEDDEAEGIVDISCIALNSADKSLDAGVGAGGAE
jgi:spectinomycin phosphotransferase